MTVGLLGPGVAELVPAQNQLWQVIAVRLKAAGVTGLPTQPDPTLQGMAMLDCPDLLLGMASAWLVACRPTAVSLVATPRYRAPGASGTRYRGFIVVRSDEPAQRLIELRGRRCALSSRDSNSAMNLLRAAIAPVAQQGHFFSSVIETGSHAASLAAVAAGEADVAAIDCIHHALLARFRPNLLADIRVLAVTAASPCPPLVTMAGCPPERLQLLRDSLRAALVDPSLAEARAAMLLDGYDIVPERAYRAVRTLATQAAARGYPELA